MGIGLGNVLNKALTGIASSVQTAATDFDVRFRAVTPDVAGEAFLKAGGTGDITAMFNRIGDQLDMVGATQRHGWTLDNTVGQLIKPMVAYALTAEGGAPAHTIDLQFKPGKTRGDGTVNLELRRGNDRVVRYSVTLSDESAGFFGRFGIRKPEYIDVMRNGSGYDLEDAKTFVKVSDKSQGKVAGRTIIDMDSQWADAVIRDGLLS